MGNYLSTMRERDDFDLEDWPITLFGLFIIPVLFVAVLDEEKILALVKMFGFQAANLQDADSEPRRKIDSEPQDAAKLDANFIVTEHTNGSTKEKLATSTPKVSTESKMFQASANQKPGCILRKEGECKQTRDIRPLLLEEISRGMNNLELTD
ncbi:hypothetical protein EDC01DRAFT_636914 [Geopyxis carbonaria]|nr:hypothetical protein EDC01DRAFT_636914 [Geopyxis carbonaria]